MNVLIIDDMPLNRKIFEAYLRHYGVNVATAGSVREGLQRLESDAYNAVIIDMYLPDGTGKAILNWLNDNGNWPEKVIISSSDELKPSEERMLINNGVMMLPKPINFKQLSDLLGLEP